MLRRAGASFVLIQSALATFRQQFRVGVSWVSALETEIKVLVSISSGSDFEDFSVDNFFYNTYPL
jgi:hypothetical protein